VPGSKGRRQCACQLRINKNNKINILRFSETCGFFKLNQIKLHIAITICQHLRTSEHSTLICLPCPTLLTWPIGRGQFLHEFGSKGDLWSLGVNGHPLGMPISRLRSVNTKQPNRVVHNKI
jgi:hypothetical protein